MIPLRSFGKTDVKISALGLGGHHLGAAKDEATAVEIVTVQWTAASLFMIAAGNITGESQKTGWVKGFAVYVIAPSS